MIRSFFIGLAAGQRAMTPLAVLVGAARQNKLPAHAPALLSHPLVTAGGVALAGLEMAGDKMKTAPDRIVPAGLIARAATASFAGAVLAEKDRRVAGGVIAGVTALASSYVGWRLRLRAMAKYGQTGTGFVEDALTLGGAWAAAAAARQ